MSGASLLGVVAIAAAGVFAHGPANAEIVDGNRLLQQCKSKSVSGEAFCIGYIVGVADAHSPPDSRYRVCLPESVKVDLLQDIVIKYLEGNPRERHLSATFSALYAINDAFPCLKQ